MILYKYSKTTNKQKEGKQNENLSKRHHDTLL